MRLEFKTYKLEDLGKIYSSWTPSIKISEYGNGYLNWLFSGKTKDTYIYTTEKTITQLCRDNLSTKLVKKETLSLHPQKNDLLEDKLV